MTRAEGSEMKTHKDFNGAAYELVAIVDIVIPRYQREQNERWANDLASDWNSHLFRPVTVVRRSDGKFDCIDGQHTVLAAELRGHTHIPAIVYASMPESEAAGIFSDLNSKRRKPEAYDLWNADFIARRSWAVTLYEITQKYDLQIAKGGGDNPRHIRAIGALREFIERRGQADVVSDALDILTTAYPADDAYNTSRTERSLIVGMIDLIVRAKAFDAYDKERFKSKLSRATYKTADVKLKVTPDGFQNYLKELLQSGALNLSVMNSIGSGGQSRIYGKAFALAILGKELTNKVYGA